MQNKFVKTNTKLLSKIKYAIKNEEKKRIFDFNHEVYNVKHLTECPRRLMYRVNAVEEVNIENVKRWEEINSRDYTVKKWIDFFSLYTKIKVVDKDVVATDCNYNLVGNIDAVLDIGGCTSVLVIDPLNSKEFQKAKKTDGLRRQIVEVMTLLWMIELDNGILLCENKDTNEYFMSHVIQYKPIIESVKIKFKDLTEKKILQQIPDRVYKNPNNAECEICEYKTKCWENDLINNTR